MAIQRRIFSSWFFLLPVLLVSASGTALGLLKALEYDATPGVAGTARAEWPADCGLEHVAGRPTLVMTVHPNCPCSRASLSEVAVLLARYPGGVTAYVLFERPAGFTEEWEGTALWKDAGITGVVRVKDEGHVGVQAFGARTSGQVMVYDGEGVLRFSGGITSARGHEGDNDGLTAIETFLKTGRMPVGQTPVYGCALQ